MPPVLRWAIAIALVGGVAFWLLTRPAQLSAAVADMAGGGDPVHGEEVFLAAGCASCHTAPEADAGGSGSPAEDGAQAGSAAEAPEADANSTAGEDGAPAGSTAAAGSGAEAPGTDAGSDAGEDGAETETDSQAAGSEEAGAPTEASDAAAGPVLAGGRRFVTPFGTFVAPNISPNPEVGIGAWSDADVLRALTLGVSPRGTHYYPAFPYATYTRADPADLRDLIAYWRTLPPSDAASLPHELSFPFTMRRGIGLWKRAFLRDGWVVEGDLSEQALRGRYLAEALAHCGECHTPRNLAGGPDWSRWLGGAPNPAGKGRIPNITPGGLDWSEADIAAYLRTGFTPEFDVVGGEMAAVVDKLGKLPEAETDALAAYLKAVPAVEAAAR